MTRSITTITTCFVGDTFHLQSRTISYYFHRSMIIQRRREGNLQALQKTPPTLSTRTEQNARISVRISLFVNIENFNRTSTQTSITFEHVEIQRCFAALGRFAFPKSRFALQAAILLTLGDKSGSARALGPRGLRLRYTLRIGSACFDTVGFD